MIEPHLTDIFTDICYHNSKARKFYIRDLVGFLKKQMVTDLKYLINTKPKEDYYLLKLYLEEELKKQIRYQIGRSFIETYEDLEELQRDDTVSIKATGIMEKNFEIILLAKSFIHDKEYLVNRLLDNILSQLKNEPIEKTMEDVKNGLISELNEQIKKLTQ